MAVAPEARLIILKKVKPLAPDFHRHIIKGQLPGKTVCVGERYLVYQVQETVPAGPVLVTERTEFEFA